MNRAIMGVIIGYVRLRSLGLRCNRGMRTKPIARFLDALRLELDSNRRRLVT